MEEAVGGRTAHPCPDEGAERKRDRGEECGGRYVGRYHPQEVSDVLLLDLPRPKVNNVEFANDDEEK